MRLLSVIIPVFNEEQCLPELLNQLDSEISSQSMQANIEVIFIDDCSIDDSFKMLVEARKTRPWVRVIQLMKNSGGPIAVLAGLSRAKGDAAFLMSADLQDPPSLISKFYEIWNRGVPLVVGVRKSREDPYFSQMASKALNYLISKLVLKKFPRSGCDVMLMDKLIYDAIVVSSERHLNPFVLAMLLCDQIETIEYDRRKRFQGQSKWSLSRKLKYGMDTLITSGGLPLRLIYYMSALAFAFSAALSIFLVIAYLMGKITVPGWTSLMVMGAFFSGTILLSLSILGSYLSRNYDQSKKRPLFIISKDQ